MQRTRQDIEHCPLIPQSAQLHKIIDMTSKFQTFVFDLKTFFHLTVLEYEIKEKNEFYI